MMLKLHSGVRIGDFVKPAGHNVSDRQKWWKVIDITGPRSDRLVTVDRYGYEREFAWTQGRKWKVWQPGDDRSDG